ncbi:MAG: hypothetical protein AAFW66_03355 [Pseudomonadota bacterium]
MIRAVLVMVIVAFALAAGGVNKLVENYNDRATLEIAASQDVIKAGIEQCCDGESEESDFENPRCLGDNCISTISALSSPQGYGNKIRLTLAQDIGTLEPNRFLRPPIS